MELIPDWEVRIGSLGHVNEPRNCGKAPHPIGSEETRKRLAESETAGTRDSLSATESGSSPVVHQGMHTNCDERRGGLLVIRMVLNSKAHSSASLGSSVAS